MSKTKKPGMQLFSRAGTTEKMGGIPVKIVSEKEAESCDIVVCVLSGEEQEEFRSTNVYTRCHDCQRAITHRPHVPKIPPKVCIECAMKRMAAESQDIM
jgi:hypothetical protein